MVFRVAILFTMHLRKIILLSGICATFLLTNCKKSTVRQGGPSTPPEETCVQGAGLKNGDIVPGRYIISFNGTIYSRSMSAARIRDISEEILERNEVGNTSLKETFAGEPGGFVAQLSAEEAARIKSDDAVAIVEPDRIISLATCFTVVEPRLVTWNITRVGYGEGTGKTAWIIDTGVDFEHPDLNVDANRSRSFLPGIASADDENGHGTHVGGIIAAKNNSFGTLGVASGANLVSLRVLDKNGSGLLSYIIQALAYVNTNALAGDVVNMSLGDEEGISATLDQQVISTAARGIYFSIAAGNEHDFANKFSPARVNGSNIYTVSAVDSLDNFASFSNYGNDAIDYAAPGVRILSTFHDNRYAYMSGTSMAAPHMAGLLLLKGNAITTSGTARNDPDGVADPIAHY